MLIYVVLHAYEGVPVRRLETPWCLPPLLSGADPAPAERLQQRVPCQWEAPGTGSQFCSRPLWGPQQWPHQRPVPRCARSGSGEAPKAPRSQRVGLPMWGGSAAPLAGRASGGTRHTAGRASRRWALCAPAARPAPPHRTGAGGGLTSSPPGAGRRWRTCRAEGNLQR